MTAARAGWRNAQTESGAKSKEPLLLLSQGKPVMGREFCKFKTGSKKVLPADSAAALSPPGPSHFRHGRPLDFQLTLAGHSPIGNHFGVLDETYNS